MEDSMAEQGAGTRAFVAGATGYVGRQVVRRLCEQGVRTVAHVRPTSSRLHEWTERFAEMGAETLAVPWNAEEIQSCLATCAPTHVFCLLGTTRALAKSDQVQGDIYDAVDYRLAHMLVQACSTLVPPPRIIYLSSIGASARSRSAYLRARGRIEEELEASTLSYVSARPSIISGSDRDKDRPLERLSARIGDGALGIIGHLGGRGLKERYQSTSATCLADNLVRIALGSEEGALEGARLRT